MGAGGRFEERHERCSGQYACTPRRTIREGQEDERRRQGGREDEGEELQRDRSSRGREESDSSRHMSNGRRDSSQHTPPVTNKKHQRSCSRLRFNRQQGLDDKVVDPLLDGLRVYTLFLQVLPHCPCTPLVSLVVRVPLCPLEVGVVLVQAIVRSGSGS